MITTNCKPLDWMISRAVEYDKSSEHTVYRFRGNVRYGMVGEVRDWMKAQNANYCDGRTRTSYTLTMEEKVDEVRRWYNLTSVSFSCGNYKSTAADAEVFVTIYDCSISDEDWAEMQKAA